MARILDKIKEILKKPSNQTLDEFYDKRRKTWLRKKRENLNKAYEKAFELVRRYEIKSTEYAIDEIPDDISVEDPMIILLLAVDPDNFAKIIQNENINAIEMIIPSDREILSKNSLRMFYADLGFVRIITDAYFNINDFFKTKVWDSYMQEIKELRGKPVKAQDIYDLAAKKGILFHDAITDKEIINIFLSDIDSPGAAILLLID